MLNNLLKSSFFQVFLNKRIQESCKTFDKMSDCELLQSGFYVVKHKFSEHKEIVYLCEFEIDNKRFSRIGIHDFLFFQNVETFSLLDFSN